MPHLYNPVLECPNCHLDIRVPGRIEYDADGPDWKPEEPELCRAPGCDVVMYSCCTTRCGECRRPLCEEHLAKTDCGMLCSECAVELAA